MESVVKMRGTPSTLVINDNVLEIWCSSPTGDSSDSHIFHIPCVSNAQAEALGIVWAKAFNLYKDFSTE